MTSKMTSLSNRPDKITQLTQATQMTLRGLREYAQAEGVLVELKVGLELTSDLSQWKQSVRNGGVMWESSVWFCEALRRLCTGRELACHMPDRCLTRVPRNMPRSLASTHFCGAFHDNPRLLRLTVVTDQSGLDHVEWPPWPWPLLFYPMTIVIDLGPATEMETKFNQGLKGWNSLNWLQSRWESHFHVGQGGFRHSGMMM